MAYERPCNRANLSKEEKRSLLRDYVTHYEEAAAVNQSALNRKAPRNAFADLLDNIGVTLLEESDRLANEPGPIHQFLDANPLPQVMDGLLPREFRAFCLAINALKQWVAAEQSATDRYLLGGSARELCRAAASTCLVTGENLDTKIELHHPVRDGRPPLPLSKVGHDLLEGQHSGRADDPVEAELVALKRQGNRSWAMLRRGCLELGNLSGPSATRASTPGDRTFARKATAATGLSYSALLEWLNARGH